MSEKDSVCLTAAEQERFGKWCVQRACEDEGTYRQLQNLPPPANEKETQLTVQAIALRKVARLLGVTESEKAQSKRRLFERYPLPWRVDQPAALDTFFDGQNLPVPGDAVPAIVASYWEELKAAGDRLETEVEKVNSLLVKTQTQAAEIERLKQENDRNSAGWDAALRGLENANELIARFRQLEGAVRTQAEDDWFRDTCLEICEALEALDASRE